MRRRLLLISGVIVFLIGAGLYAIGQRMHADSILGEANVGAGPAMIFGDIFGVLGLCLLIAWAVTSLVVGRKERSFRRR